MGLVREKRNSSNLTRYYRDENLAGRGALIRRLCEARALDGVSISYILLSDLLNRSDEGSDSIRLSGDAGPEDIEDEVNKRNIDMISAYGTFRDKPVVIGINLIRTEVFITIRKSSPADIDALEKELSL